MVGKDFASEFIKSWGDRKGNVSSMDEIQEWIARRNGTLKVDIEKVDFSYDGFWYYDTSDGFIRNRNNSFFQLAGCQVIEDDQIIEEQPIIIQNEIGYLGIICKIIHGTLNFLMQAKIEPGNINAIQISPTLQATKSNFTKKHGGDAPKYLDFFLNSKKYHIIVDQVQSEQSSRFFKKRNRNIVLLVEDDIPVSESHKWMTLGQIKELMKINNLVNMDTRTVLSCLPISFFDLINNKEEKNSLADKSLSASIFKKPDYDMIHKAFHFINERRMYREESFRLVPLKSLKNWHMTDKEIVCKRPYSFKVVYCRIEIEGREIKYWEQPLVEALGIAVIGVFTCVDDGIRKYLVRIKTEIGCFDAAELGPCVQLEPSYPREKLDGVEDLFVKKLENNENVVTNVLLSEEGGRFYHEQNRNVIIEIEKHEIQNVPEDYFWMDYATISCMIQFNNCVNIQLRNLISLIDF